jgi:type 1 glutamine amidotransferase
MEIFATTTKIKTAVVTGAHPFDVPGFHALWRSLEELDVYVQSLDDFASDVGKVRDRYDAVVLYHMVTSTPAENTDGQPWYQRRQRQAMESLGETPQGIVVLHHALLAYPDWPLWSDLVGIEDRRISSYHMQQRIPVRVAAEHPITRGVVDWELGDETYVMRDAAPEQGNTVLLTTDHERSARTLAWTRQFRSARVFSLQSGHDCESWADESFRTVLRNGIRWCSARE